MGFQVCKRDKINTFNNNKLQIKFLKILILNKKQSKTDVHIQKQAA